LKKTGKKFLFPGNVTEEANERNRYIFWPVKKFLHNEEKNDFSNSK
jgi:hypothetical protein